MIEILDPGLYATLVLKKSPEMVKFGISTGGPMDRISADDAHELIDQSCKTPIIEFTLKGPTLKFHAPTHIAITGALGRHHLNNEEISNGLFPVKANDILKCGFLSKGNWAYIAIENIYPSLDIVNKSFRNITYIQFEKVSNTRSRVDFNFPPKTIEVVSLYPGPEFEWFSREQISILENNLYTFDANSNRMATILNGTPIHTGLEKEMISSGTIPGTVQINNSGMPVILMRDCQTIGGFPRIGVLDVKSISKLSQISPGGSIQFHFL